jgi:hypothetical protein
LSHHTFQNFLDQDSSPSSWGRLHCIDQTPAAQLNQDFLEQVPAMASTVLGLEMLLSEPVIDLQLASDLVLSDVGATLQVLRLCGCEAMEERPVRMGDCLASLEARAWFEAISAHTFACDRENSETTAVWNHCRLIAQYSRIIAEGSRHVSPDEAYMVGLLYGVGALPSVLGWPHSVARAMSSMKAVLPLFVLDAMHSINDPGPPSHWRLILTAAHGLAGVRHEEPAFSLPGPAL